MWGKDLDEKSDPVGIGHDLSLGSIGLGPFKIGKNKIGFS